jgi:hypothetical protein
MKENFTSINVIIDESGSMGGLVTDTVGGFNKFVADQKAFPGEAVFTLCTFNYGHKFIHDFEKLASVKDLTMESYRPSGGTALLDAMGTTIKSVGAKLAAMPEDERPGKVLFLVITDGQENASKEFTKVQIKEMVKHQSDVYNWEFVFTGANMDAIGEAATIGVDARKSLNYNATPVGTRALYRDISEGTSKYRSGGTSKSDAFFDSSKVVAPVKPEVK